MGASGFGLRCLMEVRNLSGITVTGVVTAPREFPISYRPQGVTNVLHADIVSAAREWGMPVLAMTGGMKDAGLLDTVRGWSPELILVVGWYHMIPKTILEMAPVIGLHASLLPDYSGGAPLVWAIIGGEDTTGITLFRFDSGVDSGDIIGQRSEPILLNDTIATLYARIEERGLELLREQLPRIASGTAVFAPQDETRRRIMPQRGPEDGRIDWTWGALRLYNFIRAQTRPYPGAFGELEGSRLYIWEAKLFDERADNPSPNSVPGGHLLKLVTEGPLQGMLVSSGGGDHPLLLTQVGRGYDELIPAVELARNLGYPDRDVFLR